MTQGHLVGDDTDLDEPPLDTGEAIDSPVAGLTITLGYGPSLFDGRFGLSAKKPSVLVDLPPLPNEDLDPDYVGGDLCLQACSGNPLVAFHAVRNLARLGLGVVDYNWMELGFGRTSTTSTAEQTPRNLLGFKDGTRNIKAQQTDLLDDYVWVGNETDQAWMRGGSYLVARRIQIFIENWDRDVLGDQQNVIGRAKTTGAPLSGGGEFTTPDFTRRDDQGHPVIAVERPHPPGQPRGERRHAPAAAGLLLHRRHRSGAGHAPGRPVLHRLHEEAGSVHRAAAEARDPRCPERVHHAHRQRHLRHPARSAPRSVLGGRPADRGASLSARPTLSPCSERRRSSGSSRSPISRWRARSTCRRWSCRVIDESPFALVVDANGTSVRITPVGAFTPHPFTIAGWEVDDIDATIAVLVGRGVTSIATTAWSNGRTGHGRRRAATWSPGSPIPTATPCR